MIRPVTLACFLLFAIGCASGGDSIVADETQVAPEFVQFPKFGVELRPPIAFDPMLSEDMFRLPSGGAYVSISAKPRRHEVDRSTGEDLFQMPRIRLIDEEEREVSGERAMLFHYEDKLLGDIAYVNWLLIVGVGDQTVSVTGACEKDKKARYGAAIKASVLSLRTLKDGASAAEIGERNDPVVGNTTPGDK